MIIRNGRLGSLKHRIRGFTVKYCQKLALDKAKTEKSIEDRLNWAEKGGNPLEIELAKRNIECKASEHYKGFVVRTRLDRESIKTVKYDVSSCRKELQRFFCQHIENIMSLDRHRPHSDQEICNTFRAYFYAHFGRLPDLLVKEFSRYLSDFPTL